ncbi:MAG: hypothetical protein Q4F63_06555 [Clostridia bacterium]|nr:hypothetical protein [Clostridia bacterium]
MKKCVAVIEIASNELRLKIGEKNQDKVRILEAISNPLALGRDTFHSGKISFESLKKASDIINGYKAVARDYGIKNIYAVATTAVRESKNKDFVLDQLKVKTGLDLRVIDDTQEKIYINKITLATLGREEMNSTLIAHLGSGNISIFILKDGKVVAGQNIKIGALRISELFDDYRENTASYVQIIKEYLVPFQEAINNFVTEKLQNFVISGNEIETISRMCKAKNKNGTNIISREGFMETYKAIKDLTPEEIAEKYDISVDNAENILPAIIIYSRLVKLTSGKNIISPILTAGDAILYSELFPESARELNRAYDEYSIISAKNIEKRFLCDEEYSDVVSETALKIFDKMKKIHGLGTRERLLLHIAAILEEIGRTVNIREHDRLSYHMIKGLDIVGINEEEKHAIAAIAYYHDEVLPYEDNGVYGNMPHDERVMVCKLSAVLKLANAVNKSRSHKFDNVNVRLSNNQIIVTISTYKNIELEKWAFNKNKQLFEDVYGIKTVLNKRSVM